MAAISQSHVAGPVSDTSANTFDVHSDEGNRPDTAASTSRLCSDVDAAPKDKGAHPALDPCSPHGPVYVDNYAEEAAPDLSHDDACTPTDTVAPKEFVRERESERPASTWMEDLGCHIESPAPKPSNRAKADEAVVRANNRRQGHRSTNPNKEDQ